MRREPLLTVAGFVGLVGAGLALFVAFGPDLTDDQVAAVLGVATAVAPFVVAVLARPRVTPVADPRSSRDVPLVEDHARGLRDRRVTSAEAAESDLADDLLRRDPLRDDRGLASAELQAWVVFASLFATAVLLWVTRNL
jgi:hypothetical protein